MKRTLKSTVPLQILALLAAGCSIAPDDPAPKSARHLPPPTVATAVDNDLAGTQVDEQMLEPFLTVEQVSMQQAEAVIDAIDPDADHVALGKQAWEAGDFDAAVRHLRYAVDQDMGGAYEVYLLGLSLWHSGDPAAAEYYLVDACWKMENFVRGPVNLARIRLELGNTVGAREAIDAALAMDENFAPAYNVLGRIHLADQNRDQAAEAFRRSTELDDSNPWPLNNLGYSFLQTGDADQALVALEAAALCSQDHAPIFNNLALARESTGDLSGALEAARKAADLRQDRADYEATVTRIAALVPAEEILAPADESTAVAEAESITEETTSESVPVEESETETTTLP